MARRYFLIVLGIGLYLCSCQFFEPDNPMSTFGISVPAEKMNKYFHLLDLTVFQNTYKNNEPFTLVLENLTESAISFPNDFGFKIFLRNGSKWLPVANTMKYFSGYKDGQNLLLPKNKAPEGILTDIGPSVINFEFKNPSVIRIIALGKMEDPPYEIVGAYLDVTLKP